MRVFCLSCLAFLAAGLVLGCDGDPSELLVDLRTDLIAGAEVVAVTTRLDGERVADAIVSPDDDLLGGRRVASFAAVEDGTHRVQLDLLAEGGAVVASRSVSVTLDGPLGITIAITRDCLSVACEPDDAMSQSCLGGRCVDDRCLEGSEPSCPAPSCLDDATCPPPAGSCSRARCSAGVCLAVGDDTMCGADQFCLPERGCVDSTSPIESLVATPSGGATLTPGVRNDVTIEVEPPAARIPGRSVVIGVDRFSSGATTPDEVTLIIDDAGQLPPFTLQAPIGTPAGQIASLSSVLPLGGTTVYTVVEPMVMPASVGGETFGVAQGFAVDVPVALDAGDSATLMSGTSIAFPPVGSAFPAGPYFGTRDVPAIFRVGPAGLELFAMSDGVAGPDMNVSEIVFANPSGPYGDLIYVCSGSSGAGDGLFTVDASGTFAPWSIFNNCGSILFDDERQLGDPGYVPMYVNMSGAVTERFAPDASVEVLGMSLIDNSCGYGMALTDTGSFAGRLWFFTCNDFATAGDGTVLFDDDVSVVDPTVFLDSLPDPSGAQLTGGTVLGDLLYMLLDSAGELRAYRIDGSSFTVVDGLRRPGALTLVGGDSLWMINRGSGQVLRVSPSDP